MRKVLVLVLAAAAAFAAYRTLAPAPSPEERSVRALETRFDSAVDRFVSASRQMGAPGLAAVADPEPALEAVRAVRDEAAALREGLTEPKALARADALDARIREFYEKNGLDPER